MKTRLFAIIRILLVLGFVLPTLGSEGSLDVAAASSSNYSISGRVTDGSSNGVEGVTIRAVLDNLQLFVPFVKANNSGTPKITNPPDSGQNYYTIQTDVNGNYNLTLPAGRYVVTADKEGLDFDPTFYTVNSTSIGNNFNFQVLSIPTIYAPITNPLTETTTSKLVSISNDGSIYTFSAETPELVQVDIGEIIIGGISPVSPAGFLRKVISKQQDGSNLVFVTEQATLEDAFESLSVNISKQLTPDDVKSISNIPGIRLLRTPNSQMDYFSFEMNHVVLYDQDGNLSTPGDQIIADGLLDVKPQMELRIKIRNFTLEEFYFSSAMSITSRFTVSAKDSLEISLLETTLGQIPLAPFPVGPLIIKPVISLVTGISGGIYENVSYAIIVRTEFTAGAQCLTRVQCMKGEGQKFGKFENKFSSDPISPNTFNKGMSFNAYLGPKVAVEIYGVFGPYLKPGLVGKLNIEPESNPWLTLKGCLEASVGINVINPITNKTLLNFSKFAIDWCALLYSLSTSSNNQPYPPTNPSPPQNANNQGLSTQLSWVGGDPDGDTVVYDVYFNAGNSPPTTKVANHKVGTTYNPGTLTSGTAYSWKVVAFDEHGLSTAGPVWNFNTEVVAQPPGAFNKVTPSNNATNQPTSLILDWGDSNGATSYTYCYDTSNDNTCASWVSTGAISQATISGLNEATTYYWQVKATNSNGTTYANGSDTAYWSFTTSGSVIPVDMVLIPAGEFQMGCDPAHSGGYSCWSNLVPLHTVYLDAYQIDKYEVTNAQYAQCVSTGICTAPGTSRSYTRDSYYGNLTYANYPVIYVNWTQANTYCIWAGKRLPTEAEWEKAAGGTTVRAYPWGDQAADCTRANFYNNGYCVGDTSAVGSYPSGASPYGALDMAGNVSEWVNDWYSGTYYNTYPINGWPNNPPGPTTGPGQVIRGYYYGGSADVIRVAQRGYSYNSPSGYGLGFRCARTP
jgi:formylglycine-generating enzyme required for sulfatase activity